MSDLETMMAMLDRRIASKPPELELSYEINNVKQDTDTVQELTIYGEGYAGFVSVMVFDVKGNLLEVQAWE
jgi:hypothetical protein